MLRGLEVSERLKGVKIFVIASRIAFTKTDAA